MYIKAISRKINRASYIPKRNMENFFAGGEMPKYEMIDLPKIASIGYQKELLDMWENEKYVKLPPLLRLFVFWLYQLCAAFAAKGRVVCCGRSAFRAEPVSCRRPRGGGGCLRLNGDAEA